MSPVPVALRAPMTMAPMVDLLDSPCFHLLRYRHEDRRRVYRQSERRGQNCGCKAYESFLMADSFLLFIRLIFRV